MPGPRRSSTTRRRGALGARRGGGGKPRADRGGRGPVRYPHRRARRLPHPCRRPGQPPGGDAGDDGRGRDTGVGRHPPRAGRSGRHHRGRAPGRARPLTRAARQPPDAPPALLAPVPRTLRRFAPPPCCGLSGAFTMRATTTIRATPTWPTIANGARTDSRPHETRWCAPAAEAMAGPTRSSPIWVA